MRRLAWRNDLRPAAAALVLAVVLSAVMAAHWRGTVRETRATEEASSRLEGEIADLEVRLEEVRRDRAALAPADRGHGPGGLRCEDERWYFEGPTAASAALDLIATADRVGYLHLAYDADETAVASTFPPPDAADLPVRGHVDIERWPVRFRMETTYASVVAFLERVADAEPAFALENVQLRVARDGRGDVQDRVVVSGLLASHWFRARGNGDGS